MHGRNRQDRDLPPGAPVLQRTRLLLRTHAGGDQRRRGRRTHKHPCSQRQLGLPGDRRVQPVRPEGSHPHGHEPPRPDGHGARVHHGVAQRQREHGVRDLGSPEPVNNP